MSLPKIPSTGNVSLDKYLRDLSVALQRELATKYSPTTPVSSVLLASPNGSVYTVTITDAGILETTLVQNG